MRTISTKTLCILFGILVPSLGVTAPTEAGVIPWLYDSIFGYGWGGGYGGGYGGMPYGVSYGYGGGYAAPVYSAPVISSPLAPAGGTYNSLYGPSLGYYDAGYDYGSSYAVDSGSCCTPCSSCTTGDCGTSIQSAKPAPSPTPVDNNVMPVTPKKRGLPPDHFGPTNNNTGAGNGVGGQGGVDEALPARELRPMPRPGNGGIRPVDPDMVEPAEEEAAPGGQLNYIVPNDHHIAVRYVPTAQRSQVVIPRAAARVVRVDRAVREQLIQSEPKSQIASSR